ncbi:MAG: sensor histidine kinase [Runella slithyformis]|nr:MAG: sensor histidine kinase [Runella slithyformis]
MSAEVSEVVIIVLAGTFLMLLLVVFIISFFFVHQRRQQKNKEEKAALKAQFEQEILTSENEIKEETMKYISRELHDNVVQMLSLVKIQLNSVITEVPDNHTLRQSKEHLNTALTDLRALSKTLNTDNILHEGLANSMAFELQRLEKASGPRVNFVQHTEHLNLDSKQQTMVFRIFQELTQNIIKHAQAKNISVLLEEKNQTLKIEVQDDGIGFDFEEKLKNKGFESGAGLANMRYRAKLMEGSFEVLNTNGHGCTATLTIPLKPYEL